MAKIVRITHRPTGTVLAEGPLGWGITPFEGNYYIARRYRKNGVFRPNFIPGICVYKFFYVWMDLWLPGTKGGEPSGKFPSLCDRQPTAQAKWYQAAGG